MTHTGTRRPDPGQAAHHPRRAYGAIERPGPPEGVRIVLQTWRTVAGSRFSREDTMAPIRDDELPSVETRRRLLILQRIFFTIAIALSIISGGGLIRAALYHVLDNRAFDASVLESAAMNASDVKTAGFGTAPVKGPVAKLDIP